MTKFEVIGNKKAEPVFEELLRVAIGRENCFLGGGCIRDYFIRKSLGIAIIEKDYDIFVESGINSIVAELKRKFKDAQIVKRRTSIEAIKGAQIIELLFPKQKLVFHFMTLRGEPKNYQKGRVEIKKILINHAFDHDFTINTMFLKLKDLNNPSKVFDPLNARDAIRKRIVDVTNPNVFRMRPESARAMLRAVSFAQMMRGSIATRTTNLIKRDAEFIKKASKYSIQKELKKITKGPNAQKWLDFLRDTSVLRNIFPKLRKFHPQNVRRNIRRIRK